VWALTLPTTTPSESPLLCISVWRCLLSWERTGHLLWRAIYLEGYSLGGLCSFVYVILSFFLSPWLDQLSLRYQMVYAIFLEIIIPIPYSILYVIYDLEGRERVLFIGTEFSILYTSMHSPA
jgi:hypothetical protein